MQKFDAIRPFYDAEINESILSVIHHPMMKSLMNFTFQRCLTKNGKSDLQKRILFVIFNVISSITLLKVLEKSSDGMTTSGFEKLDKVLFIHIKS
jgi:hypothetical protein